jgi:hypothetical protein
MIRVDNNKIYISNLANSYIYISNDRSRDNFLFEPLIIAITAHSFAARQMHFCCCFIDGGS